MDYTPKIGFAGFRNIGNTCYMNSILQLLLHCQPLISFLIKRETEAEYEKYLNQASIIKLAKN